MAFKSVASAPLISISNNQRTPIGDAPWMGTIYHGLPASLLMPQPRPPEYLAFMGRIAPEKAVDQAIEIAGRCGLPLKIAAKVDKADAAYFEETIKPMLAPGGNVKFRSRKMYLRPLRVGYDLVRSRSSIMKG